MGESYAFSELETASGGRVREGYGRLAAMAKEQPLVLGSLVFFIGAAVGALVPLTRSEGRLLGEKRDELLNKTESLARWQLEKAKDAAWEAGRAAEAEFRSHFAEHSRHESRTKETEPAI